MFLIQAVIVQILQSWKKKKKPKICDVLEWKQANYWFPILSWNLFNLIMKYCLAIDCKLANLLFPNLDLVSICLLRDVHCNRLTKSRLDSTIWEAQVKQKWTAPFIMISHRLDWAWITCSSQPTWFLVHLNVWINQICIFWDLISFACSGNDLESSKVRMWIRRSSLESFLDNVSLFALRANRLSQSRYSWM